MLAPQALGVVAFEFRDVIADGNPNGVENIPAGDFSFDVVVHATDGDRLSGLSFKLVFEEWGNAALGLTDQTFTIASEPYRNGSFFDFVTAPSVKGQRLEPENASDLGGENTLFGSTTGTDLFVARVSLRVDGNMPPGTYVIAPNSSFLGWYDLEAGPRHESGSFDQVIPYTVGVVVREF
ncbi:MAG: hypothetical protein HS113_17185 [Verrucomicrobiales bacterium]|nr:hypothetical protein [Verrucomicrobiales bacterium]